MFCKIYFGSNPFFACYVQSVRSVNEHTHTNNLQFTGGFFRANLWLHILLALLILFVLSWMSIHKKHREQGPILKCINYEGIRRTKQRGFFLDGSR